MPMSLNSLMETASQALAEMKYNRCEELCVQALGVARDGGDWIYYSRIILPLQEARRQRRQAALDGPVRLGVDSKPAELTSLLPAADSGCLIVTRPLDASDAASILAEAGEWFELLFADNRIEDNTWSIRSLADEQFSVRIGGPPEAWRDLWLTGATNQRQSAAHWFMQASEALGNAALDSIQAPLGSAERVIKLEAALAAVGDHELLHQGLAKAAASAHEAGA